MNSLNKSLRLRNNKLKASIFEHIGEWIQLGTIECPACKRTTGVKVIAVGLPMKLCVDERCSTVWGEPWATLYAHIVAPIESFFANLFGINNGFVFMSYEGSYLKALWHFIK